MIEFFASNWLTFLVVIVAGFPLGFVMLLAAIGMADVKGASTPFNLATIATFLGGFIAMLAVGVCKLLFIVSLIVNLVLFIKG